MPKGKKKGKGDYKRHETESEDESQDFDNVSAASSDMRSVNEDPESDEAIDKLEEKISSAIEALQDKSVNSRVGALKALKSGMERRFLAHVITPHRLEFTDAVNRCLRRGRGAELVAAAGIVPHLAVQLSEWYEELLATFRPALLHVITDTTATFDARIEACGAMAALCILLEEDVYEMLSIMEILEKIFSGSYLKGDGSVKVCGAAVVECPLHAAAIDCWAAICTLIPDDQIPNTVRFDHLLEAAGIEVRVAAGNALVVVLEATNDFDLAQMCISRLEDLSTESHKHVAKNKRKLQRATFREVFRSVESESGPEPMTVRCGIESITLDSWSSRISYTTLCSALGGAMTALVLRSAPLRRALGLPLTPPPTPLKSARHGDKLQRQLQNAAAFKARTISRAKNRDKRSAALAC